MKHLLSFLTLLFCACQLQAQVVNIPDGRFLGALINQGFDLNGDGQIQVSEALAVDTLDVGNYRINSIEGINSFRNLSFLDCKKNLLGSISFGPINIDSLSLLKNFNCDSNKLVFTLNLNNNPLLEELSCTRTQIRSLILNGNSNLKKLTCRGIELTSLDVQNNPELIELNCGKNLISTLDLSNNKKLEVIQCDINQLTSLNITNNPNLFELNCSLNMIQFLDLSNNIALHALECAYNDLHELDLQNNVSLVSLECNSNLLSSLILNNNPALKNLSCIGNNLSSLDLSSNPLVEEILCSFNELTEITGLVNHENLIGLLCSRNLIATLDVSNCNKLEWLLINGNSLTTLNINNSNNLKRLHCNVNFLSDLNVSTNLALEHLDCSLNPFSSIDLSNNIELQTLDCSINKLSTLELSNNTKITSLFCRGNDLGSLDLSLHLLLKDFSAHNNNLSTIDLSNNTLLETVDMSRNQLSSLDVSSNPLLRKLTCSSNDLETLNIKNGVFFARDNLLFDKNPNLTYVCADQNNLEHVAELIMDYGYDECMLNSYCTFYPGGDFFHISGTAFYDLDGNDCDSMDIPMSDIAISIRTPHDERLTFTDLEGEFNFFVGANEYTLFPLSQNPDYFLISPDSFNVTFPTDSAPYIQNLCLTPEDEHHDLEIIVIPLEIARPGFHRSYNVVYKNIGTTVRSGNISLEYDAQLMNFISSSQVVDHSMTNLLDWEFVDLQPFESRSIVYTMRLNSPTDYPPLNNGDILTFIANVYPQIDDENPINNVFELKQTVVNSFDPNDKTCLEGNQLHPDMIGEYVHYLIRFENTGTADAVNVVVKDKIDLSRFNIRTLSITNASHDVYTRISERNQVEFIFENINLPFADEFNDGYIAFKVKTWPSLVLGDSLLNSAEIYFDFNFPVLTNTSTAIFDENSAVLSLPEVKGIPLVFPNPITDEFTVLSSISIRSIRLFASNGQSVQSVHLDEQQLNCTLDCSMLPIGLYILHIVTESGTFSQKVVKN